MAPTEQHEDRIYPFSKRGVINGFVKCVPIALSVFAYGLLFGLLARQKTLSLTEAVGMSATVFAGSAQFVALDVWSAQLPLGELVLTTFIVNLRHVLMSASLSSWFQSSKAITTYLSMFFLTDENWALTLREWNTKSPIDTAFLLGSGAAVYIAWVTSTAVGYTLGAVFVDPKRFGLDFAFTAVFLALLVSMRKGRSDVVPWLAAAFTSVITKDFIPGKWYILTGALIGSVLAVVQRGPNKAV